MFSLQAPCHLGCCTNTALFCMACYRGAWQNSDSEGRRSLVGTGVQEVWLSMKEAYSWSWGSGKQWEPRLGSWAPPRGVCLSSESRASIGVKGRISRRMSIFKSKAGWPQGGTPGGGPSPFYTGTQESTMEAEAQLRAFQETCCCTAQGPCGHPGDT